MHTPPTLTSATIAALDILQRPVWVFDPHCTRFVHGNPAALRLWGAKSLQGFIERDLGDASAAVRTRTAVALEQMAGGAVLHERLTIYPHGEPVTMETLMSGVVLPDGSTGILIEGRTLDLPTQDIRAVEALRHTCVLVTLHGADGAVLYRNPAALDAYGPASAFSDAFLDGADAMVAWQQALDGTPASVEARVRTKAGERWHRVSIQRVADPATGRPALLVNEQDVTVAVDARLRVEHLATHDALTDLPNRTLFRRRLEAATLSGAPFAVLMVDLDRFKAVNDTHGHGAGDEVLQTVAVRLRSVIRHTDTLARLGGDEFAVLMPGACANAALQTAASVVARLREECSAAGHRVRIGASVGVALQGGTNPRRGLDALLREADQALYRAKAAGRDTYRVVA